MRPNRRAILYLALIFLCGFLTGAVATNVWVSLDPWGEQVRADSSSTSAPRSTQRTVEWFTQQLNLSPDQAKQLHQILDETRLAYRQHELEIKSMRRQGNARIRDILNEEQKAKFDQILAK